MNRCRVMVLTGSRAEYGLLRSVLKALEEESSIDLFLAVAGSHLVGPNPTIEEIRRERSIDATIQMQIDGHLFAFE